MDFGDHAVGYVTLELSKTGSHQDAPVYFYLKFGERLEEMTDKTADYDAGSAVAGFRRSIFMWTYFRRR